MGRYQKHLIKILVCFCLVYTPFFANANTAEKWTLVENVYDQSKNVAKVTARKVGQQAANSSVYKVSVPVNAVTLGSSVKSLLGLGLAVSAITALVEGVGWIIDNGIIYKEEEIPDIGYEYYWAVSLNSSAKKYNSANNACNDFNKNGMYKPVFSHLVLRNDFATVDCYLTYTEGRDGTFLNITYNRYKNPIYDPNYTPRLYPVSDTEVGNEVLGKGKQPNSSTSPNTAIISEAYNPNNSTEGGKETDTALNNANPEPETPPKGESETVKEKDENGQETGKETSTFELPNFCEWAPAVCEFFQVQKQDNQDIKDNQNKDLEQNKTFFEKVEDWFDDWANFTKDDLENDNELDIPEQELEGTDTNISFDNSCPAPIKVPLSWNGNSINFDFSFDLFCQSFGTYLKPIIIALGAFHAVLIVSGVRINE